MISNPQGNPILQVVLYDAFIKGIGSFNKISYNVTSFGLNTGVGRGQFHSSPDGHLSPHTKSYSPYMVIYKTRWKPT